MKVSIRWTLILGFLGLIWGTHLVVATSSFVSSEKVLIRHARNIMENIANLAMEQSQKHLTNAQAATRLTKRLISSDVVSNDEERIDTLEQYLFDQLTIYPHFAGIYLGTSDGSFYDVRRHNERSENGFRTKIILNKPNGGREARLIWRDSNFNLLEVEFDHSDTYDPRLRPWYRKAISKNKIVWTDPYIFFSSQKPGITIAGPVNSTPGNLKGVVGVDIEIDQLSTFLANLEIGKNGMAFMMNRNGDVIAFPDLEKIKFIERENKSKIRLVKISELDHPLSRKAFLSTQFDNREDGQLVLTNSRFARFQYNGKFYHAMFTPFSTPDWPWIIGIHLPEEDYLGEIRSNRRSSLVITALISIFATFIGYFLAKGIIRPLSSLEKMAIAIKNQNFSKNYHINSAYKELYETADSFVHMKNAIRASQERYQSIYENIQDVYFESTIEGKILEISPSIEKMLLYKPELLIGKSVLSFYDTPEARKLFVKKILEEESVQHYEIILKSKGSEQIFSSFNAILVRDSSGKPEKIIGSIRDITPLKAAETELSQYRDHLQEQVQERTTELVKANADLVREIEHRQMTEKALRESEERYRSILQNIQEAYFEIDLSGKFSFVNDSTCRITGYDRKELLGRAQHEFTDAATSRKTAIVLKNIRETDNPEQIDAYVINRHDKSRVVLELSLSLMKTQKGKPGGFRGVGRDISTRLQMNREKKRLEDQLHQAQRMEAIGTLAGGIAHDFNNLLMGIQGNISLMYLNFDPEDPIYTNLVTIEKCVDSGAQLTRQLLGFARGGKYVVTPIDLNETLQNTSTLFGRTKKEIRIHGSYAKQLWTVEADQGQIEQVLVNIYVNAWQSIEGTGDIYLETENVILGENFVKPYNVKPSKYVRVSIADTGTGMDDATRQRIFEPFFSTKKLGRGTGLGLASAFGIVKNHGGIIDVESEPGKGSKFIIYLPASSKKTIKKEVKSSTTPGGNETILLVDDEVFILNSLKILLNELGYTVLTATGGYEAVEVFKNQMDKIDLVLLDMIMPDMSGKETYMSLKEYKSEIKIILSSGYSINRLADEILSQGCDGFIQKPFSLTRLSRTIRDVLDRPF